MEFNFNSYDNSKQSISYCEVDKCEAVIKLKKCLQEIKEIAEEQIGWNIANLNTNGKSQLLAKQILQKISECEGNDEH